MAIKKGEKTSSEEFLELEPSHFGEERRLSVRIETLKDFSDVDRIQSMLRDGNIIFLKIKELRENDINELKRSVDKLRKTCVAMSGDMVGLDEDFLIITPDFARVYRERA